MAFVADKQDTYDLVEHWPYDFQYIERGSDHWEWLGAFASQLHRIDVLIDELYEQRFLESATSIELEKLALEVGITRREDESDKQLRTRTQLRKAAAASDGTAEDLEGVLTIAFGEDALEDITVSHLDDRPVVQFTVTQPMLDNVPLIRSELIREVERATPAGYGVDIPAIEVWRFGESGNQGIGRGGLA